MRVVVDMTMCVGNGLCAIAAPEVFQLEDDGSLTILQEHPPEELRGKVEDAVSLCPAQAIEIEG
ncbi:MAG: ferredoxin [Candidatus Eremiobacteraeota bacterium]|nr:ferredoxin [Candidatus Eremiobacteraeota bacterium]